MYPRAFIFVSSNFGPQIIAMPPPVRILPPTADLTADLTAAAKAKIVHRFFCVVCTDISYIRKIDYDRHVANVHTLEKPFTCGICHRQFAQDRELKTHMHRHNPKLPCKICNRSFSFEGTLRAHMRSHYEPVCQFSCEFCTKSFSTARHFNAHRAKCA